MLLAGKKEKNHIYSYLYRECLSQFSFYSNHRSLNISGVCSAFEEETTKCLEGKKPSFEGTRQENLALQNIQARSRMAFAYMMAQLAPWADGKSGYTTESY